MAAGSKPLPLPARPMFRPPATPVHTLPPLDAVRALAADVVKKDAAPPKPLMDEIAAKDAAKKAADAQASADLVAQAIADRLAPVIEQAFGRLADDLYNHAVLTNPAAFVLPNAKASAISLADGTPKLAYTNKDVEPVIVFARAVNAAGNITLVTFSTGNEGTADAQVEAPLPDGVSIGTVLRQGQKLYVAAVGGYPVTVNITVIRLRGRASVFGG